MKTHQITYLLVSLALSAGFTTRAIAASPKALNNNVTVTFQDADRFTDVQESHTGMISEASLDELRDYVQRIASPLLTSGNTLAVTFIDLDLAGLVRPDKDNVRVMTSTTFPRAHVKFQLLNANGKVIREGERKLVDTDYQQSIRIQGRDDPLFYDKQLLKNWITKEFKGNS